MLEVIIPAVNGGCRHIVKDARAHRILQIEIVGYHERVKHRFIESASHSRESDNMVLDENHSCWCVSAAV